MTDDDPNQHKLSTGVASQPENLDSITKAIEDNTHLNLMQNFINIPFYVHLYNSALITKPILCNINRIL